MAATASLAFLPQALWRRSGTNEGKCKQKTVYNALVESSIKQQMWYRYTKTLNCPLEEREVGYFFAFERPLHVLGGCENDAEWSVNKPKGRDTAYSLALPRYWPIVESPWILNGHSVDRYVIGIKADWHQAS